MITFKEQIETFTLPIMFSMPEDGPERDRLLLGAITQALTASIKSATENGRDPNPWRVVHGLIKAFERSVGLKVGWSFDETVGPAVDYRYFSLRLWIRRGMQTKANVDFDFVTKLALF